LFVAGLFQAEAWHVQLHDDAVVHQAIDCGGRCLRILEDTLPFRKRLIAAQQDTRLLVSIRNQRKEHFHLLSTLLNIAKIVDVIRK